MILSSWYDIITYLEQEVYKISYNNGFPKIIHQSWKTTEIPEKWKISKQKWLELHPDYLYILWTDEMNLKLVETYYPDYLDQFNNYKYNIQRADFSRICYLHRYGGLYSDLDIAPIKDCTPLLCPGKDFMTNVLDQCAYCSSTKEVGLILDAGEFNNHIDNYYSNKGFILSKVTGGIAKNFARYTNMFMISKPKSVFWDRVLVESRNQKPPAAYSSRHFRIMWTTGPFLIDRVAREEENRKIVYNLPARYVNPCTVCDPKPCVKDDSFIMMLAGSSWADADSTIITWCACHWQLITVLIILIIIIILALILSRRKKK